MIILTQYYWPHQEALRRIAKISNSTLSLAWTNWILLLLQPCFCHRCTITTAFWLPLTTTTTICQSPKKASYQPFRPCLSTTHPHTAPPTARTSLQTHQVEALRLPSTPRRNSSSTLPTWPQAQPNRPLQPPQPAALHRPLWPHSWTLT